MSLNFLDASLDPSVKCSSTAEDDYTEQNLIAAPHTREYATGFMAYSVVKPPVELLFTLICPIELQSIALATRIGSLKSNGFEIWVKVTNRGGGTDDFMKVGQLYDVREDGCVFFNTFTAEKCKSEMESQNGLLAKSPLFLNLGRRDLVTHVRISIKSTERCVPVLKQVRIFGLPARTLSAEKRNSIMSKWNGRPSNLSLIAPLVKTPRHHKPEQKDSIDHNKTLNGVTIPDEFLDCITFDVMSLPMILPSGKIVDKSTIDRHSRTEECCWGRAASDPFTGVPFTARSKPILNALLKSKIDQFLLLHQHHPDVKSVPRTVGSVNPTNKRPLHAAFYAPSEPAQRKFPRTDPSPESSNNESFSLDESVRNALHSMTRFTKIPVAPLPDDHRVVGQCNVCISNQSMMYKIRSCGHLICRSCLLDAKQQTEKCSCGRRFLSTDVVRFYEKAIV